LPSRSSARTAIAVLVLALAAGLAACSSKESKFQRHLERAAEYEQQGQLKESLLELRSALQLDPKNADVNFRIAEQLSKSGDFGNAVFFYREAVRLDPTRDDAALAESKLILFDDPARSTELVEGVLSRDPKSVVAYVRKSEIALARNDSAGALQAALTAVELEPKNGLAQMQLGIVHQARLREASIRAEAVDESVYGEAEKAFQNAAAAFPQGYQARVELGRLYAVWPGHDEQAEAAYRDAIAVAPTDATRARSAAAAVSFAEAKQRTDFLRFALGELVQADANDLAAWDRLAALEESQTAGSGDAVYQRLLAQPGASIDAHLRYADFLRRIDRRDEAFAHLDAQAAGESGAIVLEHVVTLRLRDNEIDAARATLERLKQAHPAHPRSERAAARVAIAEGRLDEAAETLRRYLGNEDSAEGQRLLATTELRRRQFPAAVAAVDRSLQLETDPTARPRLLRLKATVHDAAGDHPQAMQALSRLNQEAGSLRQSERLLMARTLYAMGRRPGGKAMLEQLLAAENPPTGALLEFAVREGPREPQRAREYLERVLVAEPANPQALRVMAQIDLGDGKPAQALARIDKAGEAQPLSPPLLLLRAQVLASMQEWAKAEEEARRAFAAAPTLPGALEVLANIYVAQNRVAEAIDSFEEAEKAGALPPSGQQLLARLYLTAGRPNDAKPLYEKVIAGGGELPGAKNDLAWILALEGSDVERALTLAQEAQQAEPESPEVADTLGYVYLKKGLHDPALQQFEYAIELAQRSPSDAAADRPEYHYHSGLALQALGRTDEAAKAYERALALDAKFANADDARRQLEAAKAAGAAGPG
jgi:tetratricopeptide (TPR) repeat protein